MKIPVYSFQEGLLLKNEDYAVFLNQAFENACRQILAAVFLVDARLTNDPHLRVRTLIHELEHAVWKGLDVRILLGMSRHRPGHLAALTAALYMDRLGIDVRLYRPRETDGLHCKVVMIDGEWLVSGSHNWTQNSFERNQEVSVAVRSAPAVAQIQEEFDQYWERSERVPGNEGGMVL